VNVGFDKAFVAIYVIGRAKTRELEKFAYKMGLIEVSEINGKVRPIDRGIVLDESPGLLNGVASLDLFPFEVWAKIAQRWQRKPPASILGYGHPVGIQPLREAIAAHLTAARGVRCSAEQIIITNGTQQALDLIGRIFLSEGDDLWLEDPCYFGAHDIFCAMGAKIIPVPIDGEGFNLQAAQKRSRKARLVYVTPSHHYPLGVTMSAAFSDLTSADHREISASSLDLLMIKIPTSRRNLKLQQLTSVRRKLTKFLPPLFVPIRVWQRFALMHY
jgi:DNA-binding transcriptional MocR family regulator